MTIERFDRARLPAIPWKNGGGLTREIVCRPRGADLNTFDWRVSIADLTANGAFSTFSGVDRVIMLLDGAVYNMQTGDGRVDHRLAQPLEPFTFCGHDEITASLIHGASSDFNVMARRGIVRAEVRVVRSSETLRSCDAGVLFAARGRWRVSARPADATVELDAGGGVWWDGDALACGLSAGAAGAAVVAVLVDRDR
ncbi:MAG: HutD/Ves family protein [Gemmatimonadaceae bacterium]